MWMHGYGAKLSGPALFELFILKYYEDTEQLLFLPRHADLSSWCFDHFGHLFLKSRFL